MLNYLNGWTKEKVIEQIRDKNGFGQCKDDENSCSYRKYNGKRRAA